MRRHLHYARNPEADQAPPHCGVGVLAVRGKDVAKSMIEEGLALGRDRSVRKPTGTTTHQKTKPRQVQRGIIDHINRISATRMRAVPTPISNNPTSAMAHPVGINSLRSYSTVGKVLIDALGRRGLAALECWWKGYNSRQGWPRQVQHHLNEALDFRRCSAVRSLPSSPRA